MKILLKAKNKLLSRGGSRGGGCGDNNNNNNNNTEKFKILFSLLNITL